jgi:hypothetical protein
MALSWSGRSVAGRVDAPDLSRCRMCGRRPGGIIGTSPNGPFGCFEECAATRACASRERDQTCITVVVSLPFVAGRRLEPGGGSLVQSYGT